MRKATEQEELDHLLGIRRPTDGKPFYCTYCGLGWEEYGACEDVRCVLESQAEADKRHVELEYAVQVGDYSDIMEEPL